MSDRTKEYLIAAGFGRAVFGAAAGALVLLAGAVRAIVRTMGAGA